MRVGKKTGPAGRQAAPVALGGAGRGSRVFGLWAAGLRWLGTLLLLPGAALAADPQIASLVDSPDPVAAGGVYTYTLRIDNSALDDATNVRLAFGVPSGAVFVAASPASQNCALQAGSTTTVVCALGGVRGSRADVRSIVLTWRATVAGPAVVNATATLTADNDINAVNNTQNATTTVVEGANLALAKTGTPDPVVGGARVSYTLTTSNSGPNDGGAIVLTDTLPASVTFVSAAGSGWVCSHAAGVVTCTRAGPHAVGAAIPPVTLVGTVTAVGGTITNSATVAPATGGVPDPDSSDNTALASVQVTAGADLRIAQKTVLSAVPATAGSLVSFQIQPRNGGPVAASNAVVTDVLPAGWTFVAASGPNWACTGGATVTCSRANFPVGATDNLSITAIAPANAAVAVGGSSFTNTATITSATTDPVSSNNSGSVTVTVRRDGADLRISKTKTPNPVALGSNMVSTVIVRNGGPRSATGPLRVVEGLVGESFVSASGSGWACGVAAAVVVCEHPNSGGLAVDAALPTLLITTTATVAGAASNEACTGSSVPALGSPGQALPPREGDPNPGNDCASAAASSTSIRPDLAITKATLTPTGGDKIVSVSESAVTYRLVVSNASAGSDSATGVRFTDAVPGWITGRSSFAALVPSVSAGSASFTCSASAAGVVTCSQAGGTLAPGQTVSLDISVNRPLQAGSFTNTASVGNTVEGDPNPSNDTASDTVVIEPIADVQMTRKRIEPSTNRIKAGERATYLLEFKNNGPSTALNVVVDDRFSFAPGDTGFTVLAITPSKAGATCSVAPGSAITLAAPNFSCAFGSLANQEEGSVSLVVRPNFQPGNAARVVGNSAHIDTSSAESPAGGDNANNRQAATLSIDPAALNLLVNKSDVRDPVGYLPGAAFLDYQVAVGNVGPSFGTGVVITESITPPAGKVVRFVCDTVSAGSAACNVPSLCSATHLTSAAGSALPAFTCLLPAGSATTGANRGDLANGQTKTVFLRFEAIDQPVARGDVYNNLVSTSANEPDTDAANNSESEATTTRQIIDLRVAKSASVATVALNQPFVWTVNVENRGPGASLQTDLTDTLPAGAVLTGPVSFSRSAPALPGGGSCTVAASVISCGLGPLDAGGLAVVTVPVRFTSFPAGGTATNTATVDTDPDKTGGFDTPGGNNTATSPVTVTRASLSGTVFQDRDRNGANAGTPQAAVLEPRLAGVLVRLTGTDAFGNAVSLTATSDANGLYSFLTLPPSDASGYTLAQTQPSGFVNSPSPTPASGAGAPSAGGSYSAGGSSGGSSYAGVVLAAATVASDYNLPELRLASLAGWVYVDANANGVRDAGTDAPIAGAAVRLLDAGTGALLATATTDASGAYSFANLDPLRAYTLEQPLPASPAGLAGLANGPVNPGLVAGLACASGCTAQPDRPASGTDRIANIDLSAGVDGTLFNFGERLLASISGLVYVDGNRNNALDGSDAGRIPGVVLRLVQGADCATGTTLQTTTSAADGGYRFDNVVAGLDYLVCQTQPAGYGQGNPASNAIAITGLAASGSANHHFGETLASLAGTVYQDNGTGIAAQADNGVKDAGETGIANVPVTLTGTDLLGNPVSQTTTTDANGHWRFDGLLPPNAAGYSVTEGAIPPAAGRFADGRETAGSAGGSSIVNDQISGIALAAGGQASGYLFGELGLAPISGTVYIDLNRSGTLDAVPADGRIPGVTLTLVLGSSCTGTVVATTATDASGNYSFSGAAAGLTFTVCQAQPAGYLNGSENPGPNGSSTAANAITLSNLPLAGSAGNHFGEIASNAVIAGRVWLDASHDGVIDAAEAGIAGVLIELSGTDLAGNPVSRSTPTDASGNYRFENLSPGSYALREPVQPAGTLNGLTVAGKAGAGVTAPGATPSTITNITLGVGETSGGHHFGEIPPASVAGQVYADNNNNGSRDGVETGLPGVAITLTGTDDTGAAVSLATTTAADGSYRFANLRPGSYALAEPEQPAGTVNGITSAGSLGGLATTPALTPSAITGIGLPVGGQSAANNFGEIGQSPDLRVSKSHSPATLTVNHPARYRISVRNAGELPSRGAYTVSDRLPTGLTLAALPSGSGWVCGGAVGDSRFDCTSSTLIAAGAAGADDITVTVNVSAAAALASPASNAVMVDGGGEIDARRPSDAERARLDGNPAGLPLCDPAVQHNACRDPAPVQLAGALSGVVWSDIGPAARLLDAGDKRLAGWIVEIIDPATGRLVGTALSAADGSYRAGGLVPGIPLVLRFRDPASGVVFGYPVNGHTAPGASGAACDAAGAAGRGVASSCVGSGADPALSVVLAPGQDLTQQSLPVDPSGVVYDAGNRQPVAGATVALSPVGLCPGWAPASQLVGASLGGYQISGSSVAMVVGADGFYQFLFGPAAPASCAFAITVTPPAGYSAPSAAIPPASGTLSPPGGPTAVFAVQPQAGPPTAAPGAGTLYYLQITAGSGVANTVHNHLPIDPALPGGLSLSKTADRAVAEVGDTLRYSITVQLTSGARPRQTTVVDRLPAGFTYVRGSAMVDGVAVADPSAQPGPVLAFNLGPMGASNRQVLQYRLRVGVGSQQGDGINRARAHACGVLAGCVGADGRTPLAGSVATNQGQYRVRVTGGVFGVEACVLGKIFVDCNGNHVQDAEELGIPGVRLVLSDGTTLVSDVEGKYSVCGLPPRSHVLRADPHTLPRGSRLTTSSNRNLGDAGSLWLDLKHGELHRADFVEGSCSNTVLDQVKARRAQGEVRAPETERAGKPALRFDSKAQDLDALSTPQQGTDGANQWAPKARDAGGAPAHGPASAAEQALPTPALPMNRPPPQGRDTGTAPGAPAAGGRDASR